jgi:hypothetical protein
VADESAPGSLNFFLRRDRNRDLACSPIGNVGVCARS